MAKRQTIDQRSIFGGVLVDRYSWGRTRRRVTWLVNGAITAKTVRDLWNIDRTTGY